MKYYYVHAHAFGHSIKLDDFFECRQYPGRGPTSAPPKQTARSIGHLEHSFVSYVTFSTSEYSIAPQTMQLNKTISNQLDEPPYTFLQGIESHQQYKDGG